MSAIYTDLIDQFINAINESDAARRRSTIEQIFTPDCTYTDPEVAVEGLESLDAAFSSLKERTPPGFRFSLRAPVDVHHDQARFFWQFGQADAATPAATGSDVALFAGGRIRHIYAFFDTRND
ncbi:nuclear transport factor 2 family protein [Actinomadura alba]|uniref:Nuclear transport factor 2 family protein n=1 Tax=Actinomadura alba TaxID=406431 RepID=A0ABR7LR92_9ACTN|nr:nuclear transport factor 2 family protein [Actinomadura alba]MBC6467360.1 nuclear transport factor 2 family protein [Actinomadura alba]